MATVASFSTFVRPPGSPIYAPSGPSLVLPRRTTPSIRAPRLASEARDPTAVEARRQLDQIMALIRAADSLEPPCSIVDAQNEEMARSLQQLELTLAERERATEEREFRVAERERDLAEAEALLQHREALLAASKKTPSTRAGLSAEENAALLNLKAELDRQEAQLRENREALREREKFIEESECKLFEKVQQQQEKETELEQLEEELHQRKLESEAGRAGQEPEAKKPFDEFTE
ncbi:MAG: hypothetical protein K0R17_1619 [Rariglobus sp.]|nr:hypothetical protein [Rariglobus sp.]